MFLFKYFDELVVVIIVQFFYFDRRVGSTKGEIDILSIHDNLFTLRANYL